MNRYGRTACSAVYFATVCVALGGCKPKTVDQASLCASPDTAQGITSVAFNGSGVPLSDVHVNLTAPVLTSYDKTTERTVCTATFRLTFSGSLTKLDPNEGDAELATGGVFQSPLWIAAHQLVSSRQNYTVQPAADMKGMIYTLTNAQIAALQAWESAAKLVNDNKSASDTNEAAPVGTTGSIEQSEEDTDGTTSNSDSPSDGPPSEATLTQDLAELRQECPTADTALYSWKSDYQERKELADNIVGDFDELKLAHPDEAAPFLGCMKAARGMLAGDQ